MSHCRSRRAGSFTLTANRVKLAVLQQLQQLGLQSKIQLRDFIEKQGAPVGEFYQSQLSSIRSGKRSSLVAKQLAFHQGSRNRRTIDLHKWSVLTPGTLMQ